MRILLSAYACEPGSGSEEGVGWNTVEQTAKYHQVWVLTRTFYRGYIEAELARNPLPNVTFIYIEPLNWAGDFRGRQGGVQLHYYLWQILAYFQAKKLHQEFNFDIARHVTYVKFWSPSFISLLPIPFVWGPVGGGEAAPGPFWRDFSFKAMLYERARDWAQRLGERDPFARMTARRSALALSTTRDTAQRVVAMGGKNVQIFSEAGLSEKEIAKLADFHKPEGLPIRLISMGRLLHWKGYHLTVRAFAEANLPDTEYWLLGDGPERSRLEEMAIALGMGDRIKFWGRLPRAQSLEKLGQSHILVHPSLHDSGGWTCLEGMAARRPVICLDLGGPGEQITDETGIKVKADNPDQAVQDLAKAMGALVGDANLRERLGNGGYKRVCEVYDWDAKSKWFNQIYDSLVIDKE